MPATRSGVSLALPATRTDARGAGVFAGASPMRGFGAALRRRASEQHGSRDDESDFALKRFIDASHASGLFEQRQVDYWDKDVERSCLTSRALKMAASLQRENHLMNRGRRNVEVRLDVRFRGRATVDLLVVVDESQVLALARGEFFLAHSRELGI